MHAASYVLLPPPPKKIYFLLSERDRFFRRLFCTQQRPHVLLPDSRPTPATHHRSFFNTVTRGWVGAPNERARFRFHGGVVVFVNRCLSRTRNLAASNKHVAEFFSGRFWAKIGPGLFRGGGFGKFETFFLKIFAHSERYRNRLAGIFEISTFYGNIAFPLSPVSYTNFETFRSGHGSIFCAKH